MRYSVEGGTSHVRHGTAGVRGALLGGAAAAWPLAARVQQPERIRRIGDLATFRQRLQDFRWSEGRNIRFDYRFLRLRYSRTSRLT